MRQTTPKTPKESERLERTRSMSRKAILRQTEAAIFVGITPKHLRILEKRGEFVPRVQISENAVGYQLGDLEDLIEARTAKVGG